MQRIKCMINQFLSEPLWFKALIITTLLCSIIFSSSLFAGHDGFQGFSKIAAAIFFGAYGIKMRRNLRLSILFFILAGVCGGLAIWYFL
ncbi:hypothetical protein [Bacillus sp. KH172YL63]|uniref:hypothetical protein n=1 Tax=Bacillus sp. KH172YL63 TaxID=2709784 RepID=UPI001563ED5C|nr:hypothetical protein [Bacillus sp. KH172YL63]